MPAECSDAICHVWSALPSSLSFILDTSVRYQCSFEHDLQCRREQGSVQVTQTRSAEAAHRTRHCVGMLEDNAASIERCLRSRFNVYRASASTALGAWRHAPSAVDEQPPSSEHDGWPYRHAKRLGDTFRCSASPRKLAAASPGSASSLDAPISLPCRDSSSLQAATRPRTKKQNGPPDAARRELSGAMRLTSGDQGVGSRGWTDARRSGPNPPGGLHC